MVRPLCDVARARVAAAKVDDEGRRRLLGLMEERHRSSAGAAPGHERHLLRFAVRHNRKITLVKVADIDWIEAGGNYAEIHTRGERHLVRMTMQELEQRLDPALFVRIHRSTIVQIDRIKEIAPARHGDFDMTLHDETVLRLTRSYRARLQR